LAVQFAHKSGWKTVALSSSDSKKDLAKELGADVYVDGSKEDQAEALTKLGGADLIVCTAPSAEIIKK
jgi:propanol-preferring alcohol dehydrogenase